MFPMFPIDIGNREAQNTAESKGETIREAGPKWGLQEEVTIELWSKWGGST
jgi:hypothetical protein